MIGAFTAIGLNSFREARRNRISVVLLGFAGAMLLASTLVTDVTVYTMTRVLTDFGLGTMTLVMVLLAVFLSSSQIVREIERRTIFLITSKPVSRGTFLLARFSGTMITLLALLWVMLALLVGQLALFGSELTFTPVVAVYGLFLELLVLGSIGVLLASFSGQVVAAVVTLGTFFVGHLSSDLYEMGQRSDSWTIEVLAKLAYYVLPNLARLNWRPAAAYGQAVAGSEVLSATVYALSYATVLLFFAVLIFNRRDFK